MIDAVLDVVARAITLRIRIGVIDLGRAQFAAQADDHAVEAGGVGDFDVALKDCPIGFLGDNDVVFEDVSVPAVAILGADFERRLPELETHLEALVAEGETSEERLAVSGLAFLKQGS